MANASIGFFGCFFLGCCALGIRSCVVEPAGAAIKQGISAMSSGESYSEVGYRKAVEAAQKSRTTIWRFMLMDESASNWHEGREDRTTEITDAEYESLTYGEIDRGYARHGDFRKKPERTAQDDLSDIQGLADGLLSGSADFLVAPSNSKVFLAVNRYSGKYHGYVIFQASHAEVRGGQPTIFRLEFSQYSKNVWRYGGIKYLSDMGGFARPWSFYDRCEVLDKQLKN